MSIVGPWLVGARVLDLYAGSGALGLEALSRGADSVHFVERDPRVLAVLHSNIETLGAGERCRVQRVNATSFVKKLGEGEYDVSFADPPYDTGDATAVATRWLDVPFSCVLGVEHSPRETMPGEPDTRRYGSVLVSFYYGE